MNRSARGLLFVPAIACSSLAFGADVALSGVFGNRAVLVIDGGAPRTLQAGQVSPEGVRLVSVDGESAVVEIDGRRESVRLGERVVRQESGGGAQVVIEGDGQGHFIAHGTINGAATRFLVDTGATVVSLGVADARRAGIDYLKGRQVSSQTANGRTTVWLVKLDSIRIGDLLLTNVDGAVHASDMPHVLLGMSFLNRMEMNREGNRLVLQRRF